MDIIFFAAIALFIFLKLREQLGKISDEEKDLISKKIQLKKEVISTLQNKINEKVQDNIVVENELMKNLDEASQKSLREILQKFKISTEFFLKGAKSAFEMTLQAFAKNDEKTLEFLLEGKIYQDFKKSIEDRKTQQKNLNTDIISIDKSEILKSSIDQNRAFITVKFLSRQINYITDKDKNIVDGTKEQISELIDTWTFTKNLNDENPNWKISATG